MTGPVHLDALVADILLLLLVVACLYWDARHKRIPNWATLPGIVVGFGMNGLLHGWAGLRTSGLGFLVGFGAMFLMFAVGWMGGGDVKLMGAIGAIKGYPFVVSALFYSVLVGAFIGVAILIWNRKFLRTFKNIFLFLASRVIRFMPRHELVRDPGNMIPFGIAIAVGTIWALVMARIWNPMTIVFP